MLNPGRVTARFSRCIPSFGRELAARRMRLTFSPPLRGHALTVLLIRLSDSPRGGGGSRAEAAREADLRRLSLIHI